MFEICRYRRMRNRTDNFCFKVCLRQQQNRSYFRALVELTLPPKNLKKKCKNTFSRSSMMTEKIVENFVIPRNDEKVLETF